MSNFEKVLREGVVSTQINRIVRGHFKALIDEGLKRAGYPEEEFEQLYDKIEVSSSNFFGISLTLGKKRILSVKGLYASHDEDLDGKHNSELEVKVKYELF